MNCSNSDYAIKKIIYCYHSLKIIKEKRRRERYFCKNFYNLGTNNQIKSRKSASSCNQKEKEEEGEE
jgi:hypothetical protein